MDHQGVLRAGGGVPGVGELNMDDQELATRLDMLAVKADIERMRNHIIFWITVSLSAMCAVCVGAILYALP
jgi:hypothetical protein